MTKRRTSRTPPAWLERFENAVVAKFRRIGLKHVEVHHTRIPATKLVRLYVVANGFDRLRGTERQHLVWRVVERELQEAEIEQISIIYTLTLDELGDELDPPRRPRPVTVAAFRRRGLAPKKRDSRRK